MSDNYVPTRQPSPVEQARESIKTMNLVQLRESLDDLPLTYDERRAIEDRIEAEEEQALEAAERNAKAVLDKAVPAKTSYMDIYDRARGLLRRAKNDELTFEELKAAEDELRKELANLNRSTGSLRSQAEAVDRIESDPLAWREGLRSKYPALRGRVTDPGDPS